MSPETPSDNIAKTDKAASESPPVRPQFQLWGRWPHASGARDRASGHGPDKTEADDIMDLFSEEYVENEELRRLATGLPEVNVGRLADECREVASRLKRH